MNVSMNFSFTSAGIASLNLRNIRFCNMFPLLPLVSEFHDGRAAWICGEPAKVEDSAFVERDKGPPEKVTSATQLFLSGCGKLRFAPDI
jgi:hypothetical protein